MKKIIIIGLTVLLLATVFTGCQTAQSASTNDDKVPNEVSDKYERISVKDLDPEIKDKINSNRNEAGHMLIENNSGDYYFVVFAGEKPTGGYDIEITDVNISGDITNIVVKETSPSADMMVTQALTYPMHIIRITDVTDNITVTKDTDSNGNDVVQIIDKYVTVGEIIEFEKDSVHILTGDVAEIFEVDEAEMNNFYLGETVGVIKNDDNTYQLESYKISDFSVRHTNMGDIISNISGEIKEINDNKFTLSTLDGDMEFETYNDLTLEKEIEVTVEYLEREDGNILIDVYSEDSKINLTIKSIKRAENTGIMIIDTVDDNELEYTVYVLGRTVLNFNHSDLMENDIITVYPEVIRECYPAEIDAKMIKK